MHESGVSINDVESKEYGSVVWAGMNVDPSLAPLLVSPVRIYSHVYDENSLNIVHIHISSYTETVTVDVKYVDSKESITNFNSFKSDILGNKLQYTIVISNNRVRAVLYNLTGKALELTLVETQFSVGEDVNISELDINFEGRKVNYARIAYIPRQLLATFKKEQSNSQEEEKQKVNYPMESFCTDRSTADLPGYIDIDLLPNTKIRPKDGNTKYSVPICKCKKISRKEKEDIENIIVQWIESECKTIDSLINHIKRNIEKYKEDMTIEEKSDLFEYLKQQNEELTKTIEEFSKGQSIDPIILVKI